MKNKLTLGEGDSLKTKVSYDGNDDDDAGDGNDPNKLSLTKEQLSKKIIDARNEGITKGSKDTLSTVNEVLGTEFESLDEAKEGLTEAHIGSIEESDVVKDLQNKLQEKDSQIESINRKMQDTRVSNSLRKQVSEKLGDKKLAIDFDDAKLLFESAYGYVEKDGKAYATQNGERFLDDNGEYATLDSAFLSFAKSKGLIQGNASGGTGGTTSTGGSKSGNPFDKSSDAFSLTEQSKLFRTNPKKAKRLKALAESK